MLAGGGNKEEDFKEVENQTKHGVSYEIRGLRLAKLLNMDRTFVRIMCSPDHETAEDFSA